MHKNYSEINLSPTENILTTQKKGGTIAFQRELYGKQVVDTSKNYYLYMKSGIDVNNREKRSFEWLKLKVGWGAMLHMGVGLFLRAKATGNFRAWNIEIYGNSMTAILLIFKLEKIMTFSIKRSLSM